MKSLLAQLRDTFAAALQTAFGDAADDVDPLIKPAADSRFGDYQCNVAMGLGKQLGLPPRDVAQRIVEALDAALSRGPAPFVLQIAGPGFINIALKRDYVEELLNAIAPEAPDDRLGIERVADTARDTIVVDYSSPNVAKPMHVGHLRSTIIGDTLARVLEFEGHAVIRQNHLGDWGTQFGMIILGMWQIGMAERRGDPPDAVQRDDTALAEAVRAGDPVRRQVLERYVQRHQRDLDADPDGTYFESFLDRFEPSLEKLLPAYRFINTLESAAEGLDLAVIDRRNDRRIPLAQLSNYIVASFLQKRHAQEIKAWQLAIRASLRDSNEVYSQLGVKLRDADVRGESFYNPLLAPVIDELCTALGKPNQSHDRKEASDQNLRTAQPSPDDRTPDPALRAVCREDRGALCVFLENPDGSPAFKGPQGDPLPMIVRKFDGAFLYASTDLAAAAFRINDFQRHAIRFRSTTLPDALRTLTADPAGDPASGRGGLGATRILYVVGAPQKLHFQMLFAVIRALGWTRPEGATREVRLEHVSFGSVLGENRKMLRTRTGENVKLKELLDEAIKRARALVDDNDAKRAEMGLDPLTDEEKEDIARAVGIGAVKYADLCQNRNSDYVFAWDRMLAMQGNTAPYLMYAYARIRSIYRKGAARPQRVAGATRAAEPATAIVLTQPAEMALAKKILQLPETIDAVADALLPHLLCDYLYALASAFMAFYENCPVLQAPDDATRRSRLGLCDLAARTLRLGLDLLGIRALDKM